MIPPQELKKYFDISFDAHQNHNTNKDFRQDGKVPFVSHPWWCALMLINDQRIPWDIRVLGYKALLLHDVLEDTNLKLPEDLDPEVIKLVNQMTFETWEEEQIAVRKGSLMLKLLKLYDKIATMYDESLRKDPVKRKEWMSLTKDLVSDIQKVYPESRIIALSKAIIQTTDW